MFVLNNKNLGKSKKTTNQANSCGKYVGIKGRSFKRQKLKSIPVKKEPPTKMIHKNSISAANLDIENINKSCSQGSILNNDHHTELQEVELVQPPEKAIVETIDVDLDVHVLDEPTVDVEVPV